MLTSLSYVCASWCPSVLPKTSGSLIAISSISGSGDTQNLDILFHSKKRSGYTKNNKAGINRYEINPTNGRDIEIKLTRGLNKTFLSKFQNICRVWQQTFKDLGRIYNGRIVGKILVWIKMQIKMINKRMKILT